MSDNTCLNISLQSVPSVLKATDGREIPFARAILTIRNMCATALIDVKPFATLSQEGGTMQDVSTSLSPSTPASIPPQGIVRWDVYDLLLPAHAGTSSKIHMFGHRAALNWNFELTAWFQFRTSESSEIAKAPTLRWSFRWSVSDSATGAVGLKIEEIKG